MRVADEGERLTSHGEIVSEYQTASQRMIALPLEMSESPTIGSEQQASYSWSPSDLKISLSPRLQHYIVVCVIHVDALKQHRRQQSVHVDFR